MHAMIYCLKPRLFHREEWQRYELWTCRDVDPEEHHVFLRQKYRWKKIVLCAQKKLEESVPKDYLDSIVKEYGGKMIDHHECCGGLMFMDRNLVQRVVEGENYQMMHKM